jgi:hypothetical protein
MYETDKSEYNQIMFTDKIKSIGNKTKYISIPSKICKDFNLLEEDYVLITIKKLKN